MECSVFMVVVRRREEKDEGMSFFKTSLYPFQVGGWTEKGVKTTINEDRSLKSVHHGF